MISFLLNDEIVEITDGEPDLTVLNYLRENKQKCGTKEGCASGDCGACTVVLAQPNVNGRGMDYAAINSCVTFLSALHGKQLITVEGLAEKESLHPVQQALVDHHASQCGFCTPGFVMSTFALYHQGESIDEDKIEKALSGNLCRCTGYRPIIDAAKSSCNNAIEDKFDRQSSKTISTLLELKTQQPGIPGLYMPTSSQQLSELMAAHPNARLFAGSTDVALEVTQQWKKLDALISLSKVSELNKLAVENEHLVIGAAVPFYLFEPELIAIYPQLAELVTRFASTPIRNQATLGGNVANASPIGDMPPLLLAVNAKIVLDNGSVKRIVPASEFFTGYRTTELQKHEWIESIQIPITSQSKLKAYKVSKRFEDDISAVCGIFNLHLTDGIVTNIQTGFGGVAATPVSADKLKDLILNRPWEDIDTMQAGKVYLMDAFNPIDDVRASAQYRRQIVANLWHRFWLETNEKTQQIETRVVNHA